MAEVIEEVKAESSETEIQSLSLEQQASSTKGRKRKTFDQSNDKDTEKVRLPYSCSFFLSPTWDLPCPCLAKKKKKKKSEGLNIEKLLLLWLKKSLILYSWWIFSYQLHRLSGENKSEVAHPCRTLCNPMYSSLPDSSIHGIFHEYWSGWLIPSPGDLPDPGIEPGSPTL